MPRDLRLNFAPAGRVTAGLNEGAVVRVTDSGSTGVRLRSWSVTRTVAVGDHVPSRDVWRPLGSNVTSRSAPTRKEESNHTYVHSRATKVPVGAGWGAPKRW